MNDQQTKYVQEQDALDQLMNDIDRAWHTSAKTMPHAAMVLANELSQGLKVCQMDDDQKFLYKKFNLRIRTMASLKASLLWTMGEYDRHVAMAPAGDDTSEG